MATETRVFESVDSSPEAVATNKAYFEAQGIETEVVGAQTTAAPPKTPPASEPTPPASRAAAPVVTDEDAEAELDAIEEQVGSTSAAPGSALIDGKKESSIARVRRERRELKAANEALTLEIASLKKAPPSAAAAVATPPAGTPAAAAPAADAGVPAEVFAEAEPIMPKYEDFANEEDQLLTFNVALTKHTKEWSRWDRKREAFETKAAADQTTRAAQLKEKQDKRTTQLDERLTEVRKQYPDFDAVLEQGNKLTPALSAAATVVPGGLKAAYLLAKDPVKLKLFNEQTAGTQKMNGRDVPTQDAYDLALFFLGQMADSSTPGAPPAAALPGTPAGTPPSATPPREEPAAPRSPRGRSATEPRREDLDGDARRDRLAAELRR